MILVMKRTLCALCHKILGVVAASVECSQRVRDELSLLHKLEQAAVPCPVHHIPGHSHSLWALCEGVGAASASVGSAHIKAPS